MKFFAVILLLTCVALGANAQCFPGETQDVCLYDDNSLVPPAGSDAFKLCASINKNPFNDAPVFGRVGLTATQCTTAIREDGDACIRFYAEAQCSAACKRCATIICNEFCAEHADVCPIATDLGCFDFIVCANPGDTSCTSWKVSNNLPEPIATTTASTTRTTTASGTGTGTGTRTTTTDSSDAASISAGTAMIIFVLAAFFA